jgi:ribosomal protein S18 acetylase RimI-like enzyme
MTPDLISLRPATQSDRDFCYRVKKEAISCYVAEFWGWDEEFQREFHRRDFEKVRPDVVVYGDTDIGTFEVMQHDDHVHLGEFYLLPSFQRQGIGTALLQQALEEATAQGLAVRLEVLKNNPVPSLYRRHGFIISGQREHHFLMERAPSHSGQTHEPESAADPVNSL